jgi:SAM-dependent methyltransferase
VHGLDVNQPLIELGMKRAAEAGYDVDLRVGSATNLPSPSESMDVCLAQLIEHVVEWRQCLEEFARVLRPGGLLFLAKTNKLCPFQQEFNLHLYGWYPERLKRHFERLALTTRPELTNYARYPAVNWFTFFGLRKVLGDLGFYSMDRFDAMGTVGKGRIARSVVMSIRRVSWLRWLAHVATPYTMVWAVKAKDRPAASAPSQHGKSS